MLGICNTTLDFGKSSLDLVDPTIYWESVFLTTSVIVIGSSSSILSVEDRGLPFATVLLDEASSDSLSESFSSPVKASKN